MGIEFLVGFGDGVEEAPNVSFLELPVCWFTPFIEDFGNLGCGDRFAIECPDDQVVATAIGDALLFVGVDSLVELYEAVSEFPDGPAG